MKGAGDMVGLAAARGLIALRWCALLATLVLSVHHWMRVGYWEFSGAWNYGIVLVDPRFAAAMVWWLIQAAFYLLVLLPAAEWLSARLPAGRGPLALAALALAIGLGTRGIVGPLLIRSAAATPMVLLPGGGEDVASWLTSPYSARCLVLLTQAWWLFPFLVLAVRTVGPSGRLNGNMVWLARGFLAVYALIQPMDAPYLLTAGGPDGATANLHLITFLEGWGRQEFGYASALAIIGAAVAGPAACVLARIQSQALEERIVPQGGTGLWWAVGAASLLPLGAALVLSPDWRHLLPPLGPLTAALLLAAGSAGCTVWITAAWLTQRGGSGSLGFSPRSLTAYSLLIPPFVFALPLVRLFGLRIGPGPLWLGMVALAPYLALSAAVLLALRSLQVSSSAAVRVGAAVVAWATWTDLTLPLIFSRIQSTDLPLQGWMVWNLSTHLRASPLSVPGWSVTWFGGVLFAWLAAMWLLSALESSQKAPSTPNEVLP